MAEMLNPKVESLSSRDHLMCVLIGYLQRQGIENIELRSNDSTMKYLFAHCGLNNMFGLVLLSDSLDTDVSALLQTIGTVAQIAGGCLVVAFAAADRDRAQMLCAGLLSSTSVTLLAV